MGLGSHILASDSTKSVLGLSFGSSIFQICVFELFYKPVCSDWWIGVLETVLVRESKSYCVDQSTY